DTTFSRGTGERVETEVVRGRGKMVVVGAIAAAAVVGGIVYWQVGGSGGGTVDKPLAPVATSKPPVAPVAPPVTAPPVAPVKPVVTAPKQMQQLKVELRLASVPSGAKVVDNAGGELLGVTPLVLTRPRGGSLTVRLEKDGYQASTRTMPLDGDRAVE